MAEIRTKTKEICFCNLLEVMVGTNCPQGGDSGHGGRTLFKLANTGGTGWHALVDDIAISSFSSISIVMEGDSEAVTLIDALEWAAATLKDQLSMGHAEV